jgi:glucoside 3-dehydrogenase (cytochrome c) hitch-hiker subunit
MERRDVLRAIASATALTILPHKTLSAWSRVASGIRSPNGLSDAQLALVRAIADTIIPRTDTPSATDVGVDRFIDVIATEYATDEDRKKAIAGLEAIDARAMSESNVVFANLSAEAKGKMLASFESGPRDAEPAQTYWRLKGLIVHGYFTSEQVMTRVLNHKVMPGKFEGAAPILIKKRPLQAGGPTQKQEEHRHE